SLFKKIYVAASSLGVDVYAVGGYVRDQLLDPRKESKDIDFVVVGSGLELARKFDEVMEQSGSLVEFPEFDTARYVTPDMEIEFAGARTEAYDPDSRKPRVTAATLAADLVRRDFTVNALARKVMKSGLSRAVIDPLGGYADLTAKVLRTPLDPDETFGEDPLRMLRAARFAAKLDFTIAADAYAAIERNRGRLKIVSAERIQEELIKLLAAPEPSVGLWILFKTKLINEFLPEVSALEGVEDMYGYQHKDNLSHTFKVVDNIAQMSTKPWLRFAGLVHDIAKPQTKQFVPGRGWTFDMHEHLGKKMARAIGRRLKMSRDDIEYVAKLVRWHLYPIAIMDEGVTDSPVRRLIVNLGDELTDLLILCRADITTGNPQKKARRLKNYDKLEARIAEVIEKDKLRAFQSPVRGEDIMEFTGLKPGPTIGRIKKAIEEAILDGVIPNEYEAAKEFFLKIKDEYLAGAEEWEKAVRN
ncbi:MAG: tRNA nucleotidyltransferase, partial [Candidatus Magasanikbacteria bacterium GW2011_GWA2_56_11]